jgi:acyl dehydratase
MERQDFEDCRVGDQTLIGGRTITETDVVQFAALSGDWNALHTDAEYARTGPYGARIAHGTLTLVAGLNLLFRRAGAADGLVPAGLIAVTGIDQVRFPRPVLLGDTLRTWAEIVDARPVPGQGGLLGVRFRILNQRDEAVVSGRFAMLVRSRETGPIPTGTAALAGPVASVAAGPVARAAPAGPAED